MLTDYEKLLQTLEDASMQTWSGLLRQQLKDYFSNVNHGDYDKWCVAIDRLPALQASSFFFDRDVVTIGDVKDCSEEERNELKEQLRVLMPWRKGPFNLFGIDIDTEWRSDLKWQRLKGHIKPLSGRNVLDIGCGNGYYAWRMLGEGANYIVGLDPTLLFLMQFKAIKKYKPDANIDILPFGIQVLPDFNLNFDTVFSMGVIYHRRDPVEHLQQLFKCIVSRGELILESLVIQSDTIEVLVPDGRYAKMNNVWHIPSPGQLLEWVEQAGFINARVVDITKTDTTEQRVTEWMQFESLADFLDKEDNTKTIEGYPAPVRAVLVADKP